MPTEPAPPSTAPGPQAAAVRVFLRRAERAEAAPWLHGEVARRMAQRLAVVKMQPAVVLDWWSALGGGAAALQAQYPRARLEAVEPSAALAARSLRALRPPWWSPARWHGAGPVAWRDDEPLRGDPAQLLWANMMLHWVADPAALFARWHAALAVDGFVMFSCFGPDTLRALRALHARLGEPPPAHAFVDMHDLGDMLVHAGFADPVMDMEPLTLNWPDAARMLAELRALGGNASAARHAGLRTPRWWARRIEAIDAALAGPDGRPSLGFEIVYGHAFKPRPRVRVAAETRIGVAALRDMARAAAKPTGRD